MGIFSETLVIHHGTNKKKVSQQGTVKLKHSDSSNGGIQNGMDHKKYAASDSYNESSSYESHTVEKKFSLDSHESQFHGNIDLKIETKQPVHKEGYSGDFITCFVRSEIKWVFLKDVKVIKGSNMITKALCREEP